MRKRTFYENFQFEKLKEIILQKLYKTASVFSYSSLQLQQREHPDHGYRAFSRGYDL